MKDKTEETLWRERQELIDNKESEDPFEPAQEVEPTPEEQILVKVVL